LVKLIWSEYQWQPAAENVAFGPRLNGYRGNWDELVEESLQRAALWEKVKDKLHTFDARQKCKQRPFT